MSRLNEVLYRAQPEEPDKAIDTNKDFCLPRCLLFLFVFRQALEEA